MQLNIPNKLDFSIIIPTFNTDGVLLQCLEALSIQSMGPKHFEIIIINDGGSTDIYEKLKFLESQLTIKYFYQKNKGPAAARNLGIRHARGDIILFLDDDSVPTKDWFKSVVRAWERFPDFDGIGGYTKSEVTDSMYCRVNSDFFNWYLTQYSDDTLHPFLVTCNAGYRKSIIKKAGSFDETFKNASGEDRDLNVKISKIGGKLRLDKNILVYHDRDLTLRTFIKKHLNYGKAAHKIYARYPELRYLSHNSYLDLYKSTLKQYHTLKEKLFAFLLLTISQIATISGYYTVTLSKQRDFDLLP